MNILDEDIRADQRHLLREHRIAIRRIGHDIAQKGIKDQAIFPFLHQLRRPTFFTLDRGFYDRRFCHPATAWSGWMWTRVGLVTTSGGSCDTPA